MKPLTREWVSKAEGDYATARREVRARRQPNFDAACFHAQQCAEKYIKALSLGGTKTLPELYAAAGLKFDFSGSYIKELMDFVEQEMKILMEEKGESVNKQANFVV